jgi:hypothetical protein
MNLDDLREALINKSRAMTRAEALSARRDLPSSGIYSWWFDDLDELVPYQGSVVDGVWAMLYVGISPARPSSKSSLSARLSQHLSLNAEGSTLRLTLGVLLADRLGLELRRVGSGNRLTFHCGEAKLNSWLDTHALVNVVALNEPWIVEPDVIGGFTLPLNLDRNTHPFKHTLSEMRATARRRARELPKNPRCCDF